MLRIEAMNQVEMSELLLNNGYGHLGCTRDGHPYVVPMHYAFDQQDLFFVTTEGTKTDYLTANPEVCLQVEEVRNPADWRSVMVIGEARRLNRPEEVEQAKLLLELRGPDLTPALAEAKIGAWRRLHKTAVYRIVPRGFYGRKTSRSEGSK